MLKKTLKALLWVGKWYVRLTILLLAFIGIGEIVEQQGRLSGTYEKVNKIKDRKLRKTYKKKIRRLIQNYVLDAALLKWKFGLGLPINKSEEETTEEQKESGDE